MFYTFAVAFEHGASTAGMLTYLSKFKHVTTCTSFLVQAVVFQPNSAQIEQDDYLKIEIRHIPSRLDPLLHTSGTLVDIPSGDVTFNPEDFNDVFVHALNNTVQALNIPRYVILPQLQENPSAQFQCQMQTIDLHAELPSAVLRLKFNMLKFQDLSDTHAIYLHMLVQCTGTVRVCGDSDCNSILLSYTNDCLTPHSAQPAIIVIEKKESDLLLATYNLADDKVQEREYGGGMEKGLGERSGEVGVTEGGLVGEEQCDKETERERARARPRETAKLA